MNEQLHELLPNPLMVDYQDPDGPLDLYSEKEMLRFAEKIIQECMEAVSQCVHRIYETPAEDEIKEYFGIE